MYVYLGVKRVSESDACGGTIGGMLRPLFGASQVELELGVCDVFVANLPVDVLKHFKDGLMRPHVEGFGVVESYFWTPFKWAFEVACWTRTRRLTDDLPGVCQVDLKTTCKASARLTSRQPVRRLPGRL